LGKKEALGEKGTQQLIPKHEEKKDKKRFVLGGGTKEKRHAQGAVVKGGKRGGCVSPGGPMPTRARGGRKNERIRWEGERERRF